MTSDVRSGCPRWLDLAIVAGSAPLVAPIALVTAVLVRLTDGAPILFRQRRVGRHGREFDILKFRTMTATEVERLGSPAAAEVTPIGRLLRRSSLDELPQLVNVARGDMSIVGPRPVRPQHLERSERFRGERLAVRPGLTGLAQVSGRNDLAWDEKIDLDLEYVRARTLRLDLAIILRTIGRVLSTSSTDHATADDPLGTA